MPIGAWQGPSVLQVLCQLQLVLVISNVNVIQGHKRYKLATSGFPDSGFTAYSNRSNEEGFIQGANSWTGGFMRHRGLRARDPVFICIIPMLDRLWQEWRK